VEISGLEILPRRPLPSLTAGGILLAVRLEAAELRASHRGPGQQGTVADSAFLAGIANRALLAQCVVFRGKAAKSGRTLLGREMLFPGLNRFLPFTIP